MRLGVVVSKYGFNNTPSKCGVHRLYLKTKNKIKMGIDIILCQFEFPLSQLNTPLEDFKDTTILERTQCLGKKSSLKPKAGS